MDLTHDSQALQWIEAGLAIVTPKGHQVNFEALTFDTAQANGFVNLSAKGAAYLHEKSRGKPMPTATPEQHQAPF